MVGCFLCNIRRGWLRLVAFGQIFRPYQSRKFSGPWLFSTAEARTSNSPSSVPKAGGVVCSRTKPHAPFFHEPRVAHLPVFMNAAFGRWRVFMNTREECSSGCVRSAGSATSTEGAVAPWGVRLSLRCVGELLATCDMRRVCGGARHRAPPLLAGRFFGCWRLAGGCWVPRCQFGIAWAGLRLAHHNPQTSAFFFIK